MNLVVADWWISDWFVHYFILILFNKHFLFLSLYRAECTVDPNNVSTTCTFTTHQRIQVYTSLTAGFVVLYCLKSILLCVLLLRASQVLHNRMFSHVLRAPVHFFDTNPIGTIIVQ